MNKQEQKLKEREQFFKNPKFWVFILLISVIVLGVYIRIQPMTDHNGNPGLWDVTTNTWTLGPDLDPWLFYRNAKQILTQGEIPTIDDFRSVPRGAYTNYETEFLPYMIVGTYYLVNLWGSYNIEYAAVVFPVFMFVLTTLAFFLFVRELFTGSSSRSKTKASIIALIASFLMVTVPTFLNRTIAGIPEKESAAFFFMFLAYFFYLKSHKSSQEASHGLRAIFLSLLAGVSTAGLALIWGGYLYIFLPIAIATLTAMILGNINKTQIYCYFTWMISSFLMMMFFSARYTAEGMLTSLAIGPAVLVFIILTIHFTLWESPLKKYSQRLKDKFPKVPKSILSLCISFVLILAGVILLLGPSFLINKAQSIHQAIFKPVYGRWNRTVAENRQPFFTDMIRSLGPVIS